MGNLLASLRGSADTLETLQRALSVVQNNVTNAATPGYARQRLGLEAKRFELDSGLPGGVNSTGLINSRTDFLENAVRVQAERFGKFSRQAAQLAQIEPVFDISEGAGIAGALNGLFQSFSHLSISPNDIPARETVIRGAETLAQSFNFTATSLARISANSDSQIQSTVAEINRLAARLRDFNLELRRDFRARNDAGLDAQIHATLEELSDLVDFTVLHQSDGSMTILAGGQTTLVIGDRTLPISADFAGTTAAILDSQGQDITGQIRQGALNGLLDIRNNFLPSVLTELNTLAQSVADRVNLTLAAGLDLNGVPPTINLFTYNVANGAAFTLAVTAIQPADLAAALPGAPGGNGNALALAALPNAPQIGGFTFSEYLGGIGARIGRALRTATDDEQTQSQLLAQARTLRAEASAVSMDEEAAVLVQFQRNYQAAAEMFRVLNEMTEEMIGLLR